MSDDNQIEIPRSFIALYIPEGGIRPAEPRAVIAERYELCEDVAQMFTETARAKLFDLGVGEADVLARIHAGLLADGSAFSAAEARWISCRLAELLEWPLPPAPTSPSS